MSWNNRIVWSEGMFLRPQHFQQQTRYLEGLVENRCSALTPYAWGFTGLELDEAALGLGKIAIRSARGVLPDGTPFVIPQGDAPPAPLDIPESLRDEMVLLGLPMRRSGTVEVAGEGESDGLARYRIDKDEIPDINKGVQSVAQVEVGCLRLRLLAGTGRLDAYSCLGVARVVENRPNDTIVLDESYIPPVLDCRAVPRLNGFARELQGLLRHRSEALAGRVSASGRGGSAEVADFMMLQLVNRYDPVMTHLVELPGLHPESFYRVAVAMAGELATFTSQTKRPATYPPYRHDDLEGSFQPVIADLRQALSMVLEQNAIPMPLEERRFGIRVSPISDRALVSQATFVLAVSASLPTEEIRQRLPRQVTIGAVEQIRDLVNLHLRGVAVNPLPVAPRQLPFHSGFVYFELDRSGDYWKALQESGGFAIHLGGEFPGVEMEFWAIKA